MEFIRVNPKTGNIITATIIRANKIGTGYIGYKIQVKNYELYDYVYLTQANALRALQKKGFKAEI